MAQPPIHDPNDPAGRHATAGHQSKPEDKKSKVIPIIIGVVALLVIFFLIVPMFTGEDEVETVPDTTETTVPDTTPAPVVTEQEPVSEPVTPQTTTPDAAEATVPLEEPAAPASPTPEASADIEGVDGQESVTVEIEEPTDAPAPAPVEGETETMTVPLQEPATTPAN